MSSTENQAFETGTARVKRGMAEQLKGGVIMDVVNAEQAKIAEDAGAVAANPPGVPRDPQTTPFRTHSPHGQQPR